MYHQKEDHKNLHSFCQTPEKRRRAGDADKSVVAFQLRRQSPDINKILLRTVKTADKRMYLLPGYSGGFFN